MATPEIQQPHLVFVLGGDHYGVAIGAVRALVEPVSLTAVPGAPPWVRGIFNLRGAVVPLVDLGVKLGLGSADAAARTSWVVLELTLEKRREVVAFETDEVSGITDVGDGELLATPAAGLRVPAQWLRGMVAYDTGFALVLDLERVFAAAASPPAAGARP